MSKERDALEAVLLFHSPSPWDDEKRARWHELTGGEEATTRGLCATVRVALAVQTTAVLPEQNPGIRRLMTIEEFAAELERGEYSAELMLQHLILHYNRLARARNASITCPRCKRTSHHPEDVRQRYCGACHAFHDDMGL